MQQYIQGFIAVILVSLLSFAGVLTLLLSNKALSKLLIYFVSFAAGALLGDVFIHLLPEMAEEGISFAASAAVLVGILASFIIEKFIHWHHCHEGECKEHAKPFVYLNLVGDGVHNLIDGVIIMGSFLVSPVIGVATTAAVMLHEFPQELGDFALMLHGGLSRGRALLWNFASGIAAIIGAVLAYVIGNSVEGLPSLLVPFAAGNFIYIAVADIIPELHKETKPAKSLLQVISLLLGIGVMGLLLLLE